MQKTRSNGRGAIVAVVIALALGAAFPTAVVGCGGSAGLSTTVTAPTITTQPASQSAVVGGSATFSVVASGTSPSYQWHFVASDLSDTSLSGQTTSTLTLSSLTTASAGSYYVVVSNSAGSVTSTSATLTVSASGDATITVD